MRLAAYAGTSTVLATAVILRAFHQRANFYSACVYLSQSNACLMVLTNLVLLFVCVVMLGLQRLFYGPLRPIEIEQLYEKAWFAITETCLAMTIFREEVGGWFLVMFVSLLVGKVWGWIGEGRVEILEQQPPANPRLFHARLSFSLLLSLAFDISLLRYSIQTVLRMARPNMMVMFAFEFAVLTISSLSTAARYGISLFDAYVIKTQTQAQLEERRARLAAAPLDAASTRDDSGNALVPTVPVDDIDVDVPGWEAKGQWVFYLDLLTDFFKLIVYISFFSILLTFYGLPIHIMRDVFLTLRSFTKRIVDFLRYRRATRDMNERYPDASAEELAREDVCIICREEMQAWRPADGAAQEARNARSRGSVDERSRPKKLPCGHILHFGCLRSWLERQQICPTCRRPVMVTDRIVVGPTNPAAGNQGNAPARAVAQQGQPPAAMPAAQADRGQGDHPPNRGRVINLGPLRIGFGIGQPGFVRDLVQQLHNGPQDHGQGANAVPEPNEPNRRRISFGLRFGGRQTGPGNQPSLTQMAPVGGNDQWSIQAQVHQLEQQINAEINSLRASADQLRLVHFLQGELARLRQLPENAMGAPVGISSATNPMLTNAQYATLPSHTHSYNPPRAVPPQQGFAPGISLPPGWTLQPLHRVNPGANNPHSTYGASLPYMMPPNRQGTAGQSSSSGPSNSAPYSDDTFFNRLSEEPSGTTLSMTAATSDSAPLPSTISSLLVPSNHDSLQGEASAVSAPNQSRNDDTASSLPKSGNEQSDSVPTPPVSVPAWGSADSSIIPSHSGKGRDQVSASLTSAEGEAEASSSRVEPSSGDSKGKGRAVTVEDYVDDID